MSYLIENDKPSYKEPPKEVCFYAYKKINHFKDFLIVYFSMIISDRLNHLFIY